MFNLSGGNKNAQEMDTGGIDRSDVPQLEAGQLYKEFVKACTRS